MSKTMHVPSAMIGLLGAGILGCVLGAAANQAQEGPRYDAVPVMGGVGLQIVDHQANRAYVYHRDKTDEGARYELVESVDLTLAGERMIEATNVDD